MKTDISLDEWQQALEEVSTARIDQVPKGWITVEQFIAMSDGSEWRYNQKRKALSAAGRLETKRFTIQRGERVASVVHYRLKKK